MKKPKLPKFNFRSLNLVGFFNYVFLILITAVFFVDVLIALPLTEKLSNFVSYDLNTKTEQYWAEEYTLELDLSNVTDKTKAINQIKTVLDRRLTTYGVEKKTISYVHEDDKDLIKVAVQSTKNQFYVNELIRSPFQISVVTRKADVDFNSDDNPYAEYLVGNYDETQFNRNTFRNVYVTKLKNSSNEYSYFALFKTWPWETDWNTFLDDQEGNLIGVAIDGFVTPIQVPTGTNKTFALPISAESKEEAQLVSILYNSGVVPASYTESGQKELPVEPIESDYVKITEGILLAVVLIYVYLLFIDKTSKKTLVQAGLSTLLTLASWISYLKITYQPVDIFLLAIEVITMIAIIRITTENEESHVLVNVLLALIASIAIILGTGYVKMFGTDMLVLIILANICQLISKYYISKIKKVLRI